MSLKQSKTQATFLGDDLAEPSGGRQAPSTSAKQAAWFAQLLTYLPNSTSTCLVYIF